jgi:hypothetical protein
MDIDRIVKQRSGVDKMGEEKDRMKEEEKINKQRVL